MRARLHGGCGARGCARSLLKALLIAEAAAGQGTAPPVFVDGHVLPLEPHVAILARRYHRVPMLAGNTREGKLFGGVIGVIGVIGAFKPDEYERFGMQYQFNPGAPPTLAEPDLRNPIGPAGGPARAWAWPWPNRPSTLVFDASKEQTRIRSSEAGRRPATPRRRRGR
ncbi:hypothetical protein [Acidovorax sp.]|uniref:hypothetical protein n=1 Tax=Acidovorax sp. TaxID=1872122 RepID=UPI00391EFA99